MPKCSDVGVGGGGAGGRKKVGVPISAAEDIARSSPAAIITITRRRVGGLHSAERENVSEPKWAPYSRRFRRRR